MVSRLVMTAPDVVETLTSADVADYTSGRLTQGAQTDFLLSAALAAVRRWCGWHVTPVRTESVVVDGSGSTVLALPTLRLLELISVTEDGETVDVSDLEWSSSGLVSRSRPRSGYLGWRGSHWTMALGGVDVTMRHGFDQADDFNLAVLSVVDRLSMSVGTRGTETARTVDDVSYRWGNSVISDQSSVMPFDQMLLSRYRRVAIA